MRMQVARVSSSLLSGELFSPCGGQGSSSLPPRVLRLSGIAVFTACCSESSKALFHVLYPPSQLFQGVSKFDFSSSPSTRTESTYKPTGTLNVNLSTLRAM